MNIKKLAASLMMLSLCTVGVGNVSASAPASDDAAPAAAAAPNTRPQVSRIAEQITPESRDSDTPILIATRRPALVQGSPEDQLFKALHAKELRLLKGTTLVPQDVRGLAKYMRMLLPYLTSDYLARNNRFQIEGAIRLLVKDIDGKYHEEARGKAETVRKAIGIANECLTIFTTSVRDINDALDFNAVSSTYQAAEANVQHLLAPDGPLEEVLHQVKATGGSGRVLNEQKRLLSELQGLLFSLIRLAMQRLTELQKTQTNLQETQDALQQTDNLAMKFLHEAYTLYRQSISPGEDDIFFEGINQAFGKPGTDKTFENKYNAWRRANTVELPTIGHGFVRVP